MGFAVNGSGDSLSIYITPRLFNVTPSIISQIELLLKRTNDVLLFIHLGGQIITLIGVNFGEVSMVEFGSRPCQLQDSNCTTITCVAPSQIDDVYGGNIRVKISQEWITFYEQIKYDSSLNPVITSITPNECSTAGGKAFINFSDFYNNSHSEIQVKVDEVSSDVQNVTPQGILVILPQLPSGLYNFSVAINGILLNTTG
ncbi:fibrocystin-like [Mantella aurantiaca]